MLSSKENKTDLSSIQIMTEQGEKQWKYGILEVWTENKQCTYFLPACCKEQRCLAQNLCKCDIFCTIITASKKTLEYSSKFPADMQNYDMTAKLTALTEVLSFCCKLMCCTKENMASTDHTTTANSASQACTLSVESGFAPLSKRSDTTGSCPLAAAYNRGVQPS